MKFECEYLKELDMRYLQKKVKDLDEAIELFEMYIKKSKDERFSILVAMEKKLEEKEVKKMKLIKNVGEFFILLDDFISDKKIRPSTSIKVYDEGFLFEISDIVYSEEENVLAITLNGLSESVVYPIKKETGQR